MQLKSLLCFASVVAVAFGATIGDVLRGLDTVNNFTAILGKEISAFPESGGSAADALALFIAAANGKSAVDTTTIAAKTLLKVSPTDGTKLLASISRFAPLAEDALAKVSARRSAADALGTTDLTLQVIKDSEASTSALVGALLALLPLVLQPEVNTLEAALNAAFDAAIAAYSS